MNIEMKEGSSYREEFSDDCSDDLELLVVYEDKSWAESHGDGLAREHFRETRPTEYMLNGKHITLYELRAEIGTLLATTMINEATE